MDKIRLRTFGLGNKFVHYESEQWYRLDGSGGNVRRRRYNRPARLITPERVGSRPTDTPRFAASPRRATPHPPGHIHLTYGH